MNIKNILSPLGDRIGDLTALVQEMIDNLKLQTELQQKILKQLEELNESKNKGHTCGNPEDTD